MKVTLPYPVSSNRYWRSFRGRDGHAVVVLSDEAIAFKTQVGWLVKAAGLRSPIQGMIELRMVLHPLQRKTITTKEIRCMDLDNALKVTIDAMNGVAYEDDKKIRRIVAERGDPVQGGAMTVEILRYEERMAA